MHAPVPWLVWIIACPALGALVTSVTSVGSAALRRRCGPRRPPIITHTVAHTVAMGALAASFALALLALVTLAHAPTAGADLQQHLFTFLEVGTWRFDVTLWLDRLSASLVLLVTGIGILIHVYAIGYLHGDAATPRFLAHLNLFCAAMLLLLMADNLLIMFIGWEGVGLCSFLLIGFWRDVPANGMAAIKAFLVNRVGDIGFVLGMCILLAGQLPHGDASAALSLDAIGATGAALHTSSLFGLPAHTVAALCFVWAACAKSAQFPLHVWLPDAMAGPTPVSALIHAATMVTAGVYLLTRLHDLLVLSAGVQGVIALVGAGTALLGAIAALAQRDIKRVLAYSTISQLGFMFLALGVDAVGLSVLHVVLHALFKACLFLAAGSVITAAHHQQDMARLGGLEKAMPTTHAAFALAALSLSGAPLFFVANGFYSKDEIIFHAFTSAGVVPGWLLGGLALASAVLTSAYIWRCYNLTFIGTFRDNAVPPRESPPSMTAVLRVFMLLMPASIALAAGSLWGATPVWGTWLAPWWHVDAVDAAPTGGPPRGAWGLAVVSITLTLVAWAWARWRYRTPERRHLDASHPLLTWVRDGFALDSLYQRGVIRPAQRLAQGARWVDDVVIDGAVHGIASVGRGLAHVDQAIDTLLVDGLVNMLARSLLGLGQRVRRLQTGLLSSYLVGAVVGVAVLLFFNFVAGAGCAPAGKMSWPF